jgi:hypothetical protein
MIKCQNCGNINAAESNFCRFCGTKFLLQQPPLAGRPQTPPPARRQPPPMSQQSEPPSYEFAPPRPYAWKTDEFSSQNEPRKTVGGTTRIEQHAPTSPFNPNEPSQLAYRQPQNLSQPYHCPHCGSQYLPRTERRISTGGWITFAVLLVVFFPLFWIGLLVKEDVRVCPSCLYRVG